MPTLTLGPDAATAGTATRPWRTWRLVARIALVAPGILGVAACTSGHEPQPAESYGQAFDPIVNGTKDSGIANDAVVLIYNNAIGAMCTGTVISKNLVLTARHCVSSTTDYVDCSNDVLANSSASQLYIYKGVSPNLNVASPIAQGKEVFHDASTSLCGHDVSIIQTSSNIANITPLKVRVAHGPSQNELFEAIGYGLTNPNNLNSSGTRYYRNNVRVLGLLQGTGCQGASDGCDFLGTASICSGDSGGPAISSQGAVMGVTSRGSDCLADENVWTRTDVFKWLFDQAVAAAGGTYTGEDGAVYGSGGSGGSGGSTGGAGGSTGGMGGDGGTGGSPSVQPGHACGANFECEGGLTCVQDLGSYYCAPFCDQACPAGWTCAPSLNVCFKNQHCQSPADCVAGEVCAADDSGNYCTPICDPNHPVCPDDTTCSTDLGACFRNPGAPLYSDPSTASGCAFTIARDGSDSSKGWWVPVLGVAALLARRRRRETC